jgi:4-amino-4-deoxy-L-arabinose transferase-like glycosyltransferase
MKNIFKMVTSKSQDIKIVLIIFLSAFVVRAYRLADHLFFGYEQGRDAQIIQSIYEFKDFVLVGPSTSIGGIFHGPWYYYLMSIPYGVSGGNPLAAAFFICIIGSLVPPLIYFFAKDFFNSRRVGIIVATISIFSYEYILYSRWVSNVSPSVPFIILSFYMLWIYSKNHKGSFFLLFVFFSTFATLFEMLLIVQFLFVLIFTLLTKTIKLPSIKTIIFSFFVILTLFAPIIFFDFRNQHISFNSMLIYINNSGESGSRFNSLEPLRVFLNQSSYLFKRAVLNIDSQTLRAGLIIVMIAGLAIFLKKERKKGLFILIWSLMCLPIIYISPGNSHYYFAAALGWIFILGFTINYFWENYKLRFLSIGILILLVVSAANTVTNLHQNKDVFYVTIQDDLNYKDQKALLEYIKKDSKGSAYRLEAFTIPSLHPEGWQYLHRFHNPIPNPQDPKTAYIIIESNVYPQWENKWIAEMGDTRLVQERKFGKIRLQKRDLK